MTILTTDQAGALMGLGPHEVRRLCRAGLLPALRVGRDWLVAEADARAYQRRPRGRPVDRPTNRILG